MSTTVFALPWALLALMIPCLALLIPIMVIWGIVRIASGGRSRDRAGVSAEETRIMQEIHLGLGRMEDRIEALETILVKQEEKSGADY